MPNALDFRLRAWRDGRRQLLDEVEALAPERLVAKPRPDKWSIIEIVEHLVLADREVLQGLPDPSQLVTRSRHVKDRLSYPLVMFVLACHIPVKTPSPGYLPRGQSSLTELRHEWESVGRWFQAYVKGLGPGDLGRPVFAHPVAGPLTVSQVLRMGQTHLATHTRQIRGLERLTNKARYGDRMVSKMFRTKPPGRGSVVLDPGRGTGAFMAGVQRWCQPFLRPRHGQSWPVSV